MKVAGLFAGIGGIERGLGEGFEASLLCEIDPWANRVLGALFPDTEIWDDITTLRSLPADTEMVSAGFPCQDLSQAGRTRGITGNNSGLVSHLFRLLKARRSRLEWVLIENVRNMLPLDGGRAMSYVIGELESLGFAWAYRVVDTRAFGLPQRRQRVILIASGVHDPREVVLPEEAGEPPASRYREDAFGFYWTEGLRGLGWAIDAVPTLKGGSTIGIPSPPAIWIPGATEGRQFVTPSIGDAERLQGFPRHCTAVDGLFKEGPRWKMVGNAVSVPVASWVGERLSNPTTYDGELDPPLTDQRWPMAAWGTRRGQRRESRASLWPRLARYKHLLPFISLDAARPLSHKAASGFMRRLERGYLRTSDDFRRDLKVHIEAMSPVSSAPNERLPLSPWPEELAGAKR